MRRHCLARLLEDSNGGFPRNARKIIEKLIQGFTSLEVVKQIFHWHTCASENRHAALDFRVDCDSVLDHRVMIRRPSLAVANYPLVVTLAASWHRIEPWRASLWHVYDSLSRAEVPCLLPFTTLKLEFLACRPRIGLVSWTTDR